MGGVEREKKERQEEDGGDLLLPLMRASVRGKIGGERKRNHFLSYATGRGRERGEREYMQEVHTTNVSVA